MIKIYKILLLNFVFTISLVLHVSAQEYTVIVNNSNTVSSLTKKQVSQYLLKQKTKWADKTKVQPIDLNSKSAVRKVFSKAVHKKSIGQVRAFWQQSVFSGKASPPSEKANDAAIIAYVKTHKGAIGYISAKTKANGVKTVNVK